MRRLVPTDDDYERGDAKFEEQRDERLTRHFDAIIDVGYYVHTPHGEGKVVGYEVLHPVKVFTTTTKPGPAYSYRYMIELSPGHTWSVDHTHYFAFDNEVQILLGQF